MAEKYAKKDHRDFGAFFFILMSHGGNRDCILGVQGRKTSVENLMELPLTKRKTKGVYHPDLQRRS